MRIGAIVRMAANTDDEEEVHDGIALVKRSWHWGTDIEVHNHVDEEESWMLPNCAIREIENCCCCAYQAQKSCLEPSTFKGYAIKQIVKTTKGRSHRPKWRASRPLYYCHCWPNCRQDVICILLLRRCEHRDSPYLKPSRLVPMHLGHSIATSISRWLPRQYQAQVNSTRGESFGHPRKTNGFKSPSVKMVTKVVYILYHRKPFIILHGMMCSATQPQKICRH